MITERQATVRAARHAIAPFLTKNYPCKCDEGDADCPGEYHEAEALAELVVDAIAANIWSDGAEDVESAKGWSYAEFCTHVNERNPYESENR